jgi:hypothetical protein
MAAVNKASVLRLMLFSVIVDEDLKFTPSLHPSTPSRFRSSSTPNVIKPQHVDVDRGCTKFDVQGTKMADFVHH